MIARLVFWLGLLAVLAGAALWMVPMPGERASVTMPELTSGERALAARLEADVRALAYGIGERNMHAPGTLAAAADWIEARMREDGHAPARHTYELELRYAGQTADNLIVEIPGSVRPDKIVVIGAHYDSVPGAPGANDNATGVAAMLALAAHFAGNPQPRTLRFIAFTNEEPPFFLSRDMGSHAYALRSREQDEDIVAMMAMDGLGYYSDAQYSQQYPAPGIAFLYPDRANFIAFTTRVRDARVMRSALDAFRDAATIPSEGAALPAFIPGVSWSDHWSFWEHGYPAFLVTDTLPYRDPAYHGRGDTPERLDYERMARVVAGLKAVVIRLAD